MAAARAATARGNPSTTDAGSSSAPTRREAVVAEIRRAIVLGTLRPGDKLREVKLAAALNVSRPTLREALNLLVQDGLLVQEPYRGLSVTRLDPDAVKDLAATRVPLDLIAITAILDDDTGQRLQSIETVWETFRGKAFDPDPLTQHEAHIAFHRGIWAASQNTMLLRLWPVTEALTTIVLAQDQATRADPQRAFTIHELLIDAIKSRSTERITAALARHTLDSAQELLALVHDTAR
jgi:DNA-binding GntR family transcriptional regulator